MKQIFLLMKMNLLMLGREEASVKGKKIRKILLYALVFLCFVPLPIAIGAGAGELYRILESIGQGEILFSIGFLAAFLIMFLIGIFSIISVYYLSRDIPSYLPLPLQPYQIIVSRFLNVLLYEYLALGVFLVPMLIGAGIGGGRGPGYYLISLAVFLVLPLVPLSLASILVIFIMSFSRRTMNKDRFSMVAGLLSLAIGMSISLGIQRFSIGVTGNPEELQQMLMSGEIRLMDQLAGWFPGILQAARAVADTDVLQLLLLALISLAAFAVFALVAQKLYFRGLLGMMQQGVRRRVRVRQEKLFRVQGKVWSYTLKELRMLFRTPIYFMNLVIIDLLMPVFILVPILITPGEERETFLQIRDSLDMGENLPMVIGIGFAAFVFLSAMNGITATCISREGRHAYVMKYIPLGYREQILAKFFSGMLVSSVSLLLLAVIAAVFLSLSLLTLGLLLVAGFNAILFTRLSGVFIDALRPRLNWDSETKAVKQNMNVMLNMLAGVGLGGMVLVFTVQRWIGPVTAILIYLPGFFLINAGLYVLLIRNLPRMMDKIP